MSKQLSVKEDGDKADEEQEACGEVGGQQLVGNFPLKGILHQKIFYRLNFIFWIVMGYGIARFGRKGLKTTET